MFLAVSITAQVSQTERQALIDLYNATDGANWTNNTNWDTDPNSTSDVSTWFGVTITEISAQKYVTHIQLSDNNINGTIPSLVSLIKLETFDFSKNSLLTGPVNLDGYAASLANVLLHQTSISSLKLPHSLNLNIKTTPNLFCVEVPTTSLSHYYNLSMDNFDLGVKITDDCSSVLSLSVTERAALKTIYDATNGDSWSYRTYASTEITTGSGSVDVRGFETIDIAGERKITKLSFSGMNLNGPLPAEIDDFTELLELNLSSNSISSLPTEIGNLTKLLNLNINSNGSITTLPSVVGNLSELISLTFNSTQIDLIPTTLGDLKKLQTLEFGSTKITLLPPEIGGLIELKKLVAAPNNIASIPTEFGQLTKLTYLDFASCELSNTPAAFASLTELETLYLNDNELQVVAGLGGFTKLKYLRLHNNRLGEDNPNFNTDLPSDLGDLVLLEELTLNNNKLTSLPNSIGNLILLKVLPLQHNSLTSLPSTIGNLVNLEELRLSETYGSGGNELTSLPVEIGNLSSLKLLYVAGNKLTSLPDEIGNLSALEDFSIASNSEYDTSISDYVYHLTTLPATINNLTSLKSFRANDNHITGNIDLSNLLSLTDFQFSQNRITGLKIGGSPDRFGNGHFYLKNNPNLSCIEVDDATQITNWENSNHSNYIDNGVAYSDDCSGYTVPQAERDALISFYLATGGGLDTSDANTYWTGTFWDVDKATSISNVGAWEGVTTALVNGQKHVVNISLSKNLKGFIPSEIKDLTELQELHISTPNSSGLTEIKPEIGQLSKLTRMNLSGHELSSLPTDIGNLSSLVYLNVSNNELSSLPAGIGNFAKLEELHLENQESYDTTTGIREKTLTSLPDEIGNIASLKKLYLQHNSLTSLPSTIGDLVNLEELRLSETYGSGGNELTSLPVEIGNLSSLKLLYVAGNKLTSLPDEIGNLSALEDLVLHQTANMILV